MIGKIFKDPTSSISIQVFRYILAGSFAYAVDYSALIIYTEIFKIHYLASAAIAFLLGAITSYALNVAWVFNKRVFKDMRLEASIFILLGLAGLVLNHYCIRFFTEGVNLHYLTSKLISSIVVSAVNFAARKYLLFR
jgi:putative flippase GtrA